MSKLDCGHIAKPNNVYKGLCVTVYPTSGGGGISDLVNYCERGRLCCDICNEIVDCNTTTKLMNLPAVLTVEIAPTVDNDGNRIVLGITNDINNGHLDLGQNR